MAYTFTEKKRIRKSFSTRSAADQVPNLLDIQKASYKKLLQAEIEGLCCDGAAGPIDGTGT